MDTSTTGCDSRELYYCLPALPDGFEWDWLQNEPKIKGRKVWVTGNGPTIGPSYDHFVYAQDAGISYAIHSMMLPSDEALQLIAVNCWLGVIR